MRLEALLKRPYRRIEIPEKGVQIIDVGSMDFEETYALQRCLNSKRMSEEVPDTIVLVEHPHVYTIGTGVTAEELPRLVKERLDAEIIRTDRGGKITYHGPGQIVAYFICKTPRKSVEEMITAIEDVHIGTLQAYNIPCYSRKEEKDPRYREERGIRGVWYNQEGRHKKIAAIGLGVKRVPGYARSDNPPVVTLHGSALNVNTDLAYFEKIQPCGFEHDVMTSIARIVGREVGMDKAKNIFTEQIRQRWSKHSYEH